MDDVEIYKTNKLLAMIESQAISSILRESYGDYLIQLGGPSLDTFTLESPIKNKYHVTQDVICDFEELAFGANSIDLFLLPHTLETSSSPKRILKEVYFSLAPEGKVVIIGFNPHGFWRLGHLLRLSGCALKCNNVSITKVKTWLSKLEFELLSQKTFLFRPLLNSEEYFKKMLVLEKAGEMLFPFFGSLYIIEAKKTEYGLIKPQRKIAVAN